MPNRDKIPDRVAELFNGGSALITGSSGFLGKLLVEKLLRSTNLSKIYLLIRSKNGKNPETRLEELFSNTVFSELKRLRPNFAERVSLVRGDVSEPKLGLSLADRYTIIHEVNFIYHSAATTRFNESVRNATRINTRGTSYMLDLAGECKNLKLFVHISSAYAHPEVNVVYEKVYEPPADPHHILESINFDGVEYDEDPYITLLGNSPNTYTFTKALAETLVAEKMNELPVLIVRPSIVCPTWHDPIPGWCNNLQGPMGLFVSAGKGILRSMVIKGTSRGDFIPADIAINGIILTSWNYLHINKNQKVFNLTSSTTVSHTWEEILEMGRDITTNHIPFNMILWYPGGTMKRSRIYHNICFYLFQMAPAYVVDFLLYLLGYDPILVQIQRRIQRAFPMFECFTGRTWNFSNEQSRKIVESLNSKEKIVYKFNAEGFDLFEYLCICAMGVRRNNLKETDEMLPAAKRNMKIMWFVDLVCKTLFWLVIGYLFYKWFLYYFISSVLLCD